MRMYVVAAFALSLGACFTDPNTGPVPVASVQVTAASTTVAEGQTLQLAASARDAAGRELAARTITYSTSSASIVTVSPTGLVTGVAAGSATIFVSSEGRGAQFAITVLPRAVATVTATPSPVTLARTATQQITVVLRSSDNVILTGRMITYASSNNTVATVSATGLITAQAVGTANITVTSEGRTATVMVTVN